MSGGQPMPSESVRMKTEPDELPDETTPSDVQSLSPADGSSDPPPSRPPHDDSLVWRLAGLIKTIRPHQWVKNVFVLAPVVFAKEIFAPELLTRAALAFGVFCLLAGAVYTMNDLADVESDRVHPAKRHRPIASGRVPVPWARALIVVLLCVAFGGASFLGWAFGLVALCYFAQNIAYSFKLKHVAYVDVGFIAGGFVLRVLAGGKATGIDVSLYLLLCTALLALFLGFGKRRHELTSARNQAAAQRVALESYSKSGLDVALFTTALATVATYVVYTLDPRTRAFFRSDWLWPSAAFVVLGVLRFLFIVRNRPKAESPTQEMLRDGPFVAIVLFWVILVMWVVYHLKPS
jgi:4-hydroxybenzoate polyprenyltransferase